MPSQPIAAQSVGDPGDFMPIRCPLQLMLHAIASYCGPVSGGLERLYADPVPPAAMLRTDLVRGSILLLKLGLSFAVDRVASLILVET
jgi:hypothetical protein